MLLKFPKAFMLLLTGCRATSVHMSFHMDRRLWAGSSTNSLMNVWRSLSKMARTSLGQKLARHIGHVSEVSDHFRKHDRCMVCLQRRGMKGSSVRRASQQMQQVTVVAGAGVIVRGGRRTTVLLWPHVGELPGATAVALLLPICFLLCGCRRCLSSKRSGASEARLNKGRALLKDGAFVRRQYVKKRVKSLSSMEGARCGVEYVVEYSSSIS